MRTQLASRVALISPAQRSWAVVLGACIVLSCLSSGCAFNRKLDKPIPLPEGEAIAAAADERLSATITAIIVRGGPGSWSKNADWDEYLLKVRATSAQPIEVTHIVVVDSLGKHLQASSSRDRLRNGSKETTRRYKDTDVEVTASAGGLAVAGYAVGGASAAVGLATLGSTGAAAGAAAAGALLVAPALMTAGVVVGVQQYQVHNEIKRRSTHLPVGATMDLELPLDVFFPIAPSPQRLELTYRDAEGEHLLVIDTKAPLAGLHLLAQPHD